MKHYRAILISDRACEGALVREIDRIGARNSVHARPSETDTLMPSRNGIDAYILFSREASGPDDFDCIRRRRHSSDPNIAFAPMLLVAGRMTQSSLKAAIDAGFDDILVDPVGAGELHARVLAAITNPSAFYQSDDYFGPDRRRGLVAGAGGPDRRKNSGQTFRLLIERSTTAGCRVRYIERVGAGPVGEPAICDPRG